MLVVRGDDGAARDLVNVCRHRGGPVDNRVEQCVIYYDCYVPAPVTTDKAKKYWDKNIDLALHTVDGKDIVIQREMEKNFLSGAMQEILIGQNEPALAHFHQSFERVMAGE